MHNAVIASVPKQSRNIPLKPIKKKKSSSFFNFSVFRRRKISSEELAIFTRQLATLLVAGIPLIQALNVMLTSNPSLALSNILLTLKNDIEKGLPFSLALKTQAFIFDSFYQGLCETGEQSGTLDIMLSRLADYTEKKNAVLKKIKTAMYYPISVLFIALSISLFLLLKVIPTFKIMFKGLDAPLPKFTLCILMLSDYLKQYGLILLLGSLFFFVFFLYCYRKNGTFKAKIQTLSLKMPIFGSLLKSAIIARFSRTLATTTAAGVPLMDSLSALGKTLENAVYLNALQQIKVGLASGQQLHSVMKKTSLFPPMVVQMVGIGEESGTLEAMLSKIAHTYEEGVETAVNGLTTLLEPLIMVFLGLIVGGLVIAMYLPIFELGTHF